MQDSGERDVKCSLNELKYFAFMHTKLVVIAQQIIGSSARRALFKA